jgi:hypothetical protein
MPLGNMIVCRTGVSAASFLSTDVFGFPFYVNMVNEWSRGLCHLGPNNENLWHLLFPFPVPDQLLDHGDLEYTRTFEFPALFPSFLNPAMTSSLASLVLIFRLDDENLPSLPYVLKIFWTLAGSISVLETDVDLG